MAFNDFNTQLTSAFVTSRAAALSEAELGKYIQVMQGAAVADEKNSLTEEDMRNKKSMLIFVEGDESFGSEKGITFMRSPLATLEGVIADYDNAPPKKKSKLDLKLTDTGTIFIVGSVDFCQAAVHYLASHGKEGVGDLWGFYFMRNLTGEPENTVVWMTKGKDGKRSFSSFNATKMLEELAAA